MISGMEQSEKVRENRMRRMAGRRGLRLVKSPQRDQGGLEYGRYRIETGDGALAAGIQAGRHYPFASLDEVERYLSAPR
jgi:hypothetical protein